MTDFSLITHAMVRSQRGHRTIRGPNFLNNSTAQIYLFTNPCNQTLNVTSPHCQPGQKSGK